MLNTRIGIVLVLSFLVQDALAATKSPTPSGNILVRGWRAIKDALGRILQYVPITIDPATVINGGPPTPALNPNDVTFPNRVHPQNIAQYNQPGMDMQSPGYMNPMG